MKSDCYVRRLGYHFFPPHGINFGVFEVDEELLLGDGIGTMQIGLEVLFREGFANKGHLNFVVFIDRAFHRLDQIQLRLVGFYLGFPLRTL